MDMGITVSICCLTYNHEDYLERTLESFVMQETDFLFEVIIHDDASTDRTREIISDYQRNYPNIIKPIFQTINQYSQGVAIEAEIVYPKAKGKYIAVCEGDDYWTDPCKLQKQVDFMEKHPECSLCMHGAVKVRAEDEKEIAPFCAAQESRYFSTEELIEKEQSFCINTLFFPTKYTRQFPDFIKNAPVSDYPLIIWLSLKGNVYYMKDIMSAYRFMAKDSWTDNLVETPGLLQKHYQDMEKLLLEIDEYTDYNYTQTIGTHILSNRLHLIKLFYDLNESQSAELRELYNQLSFSEKSKLYIGHYFPSSVKISSLVRPRGKQSNEDDQ